MTYRLEIELRSEASTLAHGAPMLVGIPGSRFSLSSTDGNAQMTTEYWRIATELIDRSCNCR